MKRLLIHNRQDITAKIDDDVFQKVSSLDWVSSSRLYIKSRGRGGVYLHHFVMNSPGPSVVTVDHINGDTLDNRKSNLRFCTRAENSRNARKWKKSTRSKYKGVSLDGKAPNQKWRACVKTIGKSFPLGNYRTEVEAAKAYDSAAVFLFGEFAKTNFRDSIPVSPSKIRESSLNRNLHRQRKKYQGVSKCSNCPGLFRAQISFHCKQIFLGTFKSWRLARSARIIAEENILKGLHPLGHTSTKTTEGYIS